MAAAKAVLRVLKLAKSKAASKDDKRVGWMAP